ncbi:MAG: caspase family protein [Bacteroidetes bacterium]|jgi:uncharacterized caspase-like protein/WD40 repeat protein|nr:caspase family protein [Bacteroidota bacterium]
MTTIKRLTILLPFLWVAVMAQEVLPERQLSAPVTGGSALRAVLNTRLGSGIVLASDRNVKLVATDPLGETGQLPLGTTRVTAVDLTASGQTIVTGAADGSIATWTTVSKTLSKTIKVHSAGIVALAVQDENIAFSVGADKSVRITDLLGGTNLGSLSTAPYEPIGILAVPGGRQFAILTSSGNILIYNLSGLALASQLKDNTSRITAAAFSNDGSKLAVGTADGQVFIWATSSGLLSAKLAPHRGIVNSVAFDATGAWFVSAGADSTVHIADGTTLQTVQTRRTEGAAWSQVAFTGEHLFLAFTGTGSVERWFIRKTPPDLEPPAIVIVDPAPLPGGLPHRIFATEFSVRGAAWDNKKLAGVTVGAKPVTLAPMGPADTLAVPPAGSSSAAFSSTFRLDTVGVNEITFTAVDAVGLMSTTRVRVERIAPNDAIEVLAPATNAEIEGVSTVIQFRSWFEVSSFSLSVNLIDLVRGQRPKLHRAGDVVSAEIPLVVGYNQVQLTVLGTKGERMSKTIGVSRKYTQTVVQAPKGAPKKRTDASGPQRWAVVIGVSDYQNPGIPSLKYAHKDAEAFANFLRTPEGGGYDNEHMRVLLNKDATLPNVRDALINFLSNAIDIDLVVLYFAGHGAPEPARPQNLYLLTHDSDPTRLGTTAFPMWQIQDVLGRYINSKRIIVFTDACHSGGISVNFATRGVGVTEQNLVNQYLADLSRSKEGTVVFTASAAGEVSQEFPELGHGVFTYFLLDGLKGKADYNNDYTISINEAMQYTEEQVKRKTRGAQNPTRSQTSYDKDMTVSLIQH